LPSSRISSPESGLPSPVAGGHPKSRRSALHAVLLALDRAGVVTRRTLRNRQRQIVSSVRCLISPNSVARRPRGVRVRPPRKRFSSLQNASVSGSFQRPLPSTRTRRRRCRRGTYAGRDSLRYGRASGLGNVDPDTGLDEAIEATTSRSGAGREHCTMPILRFTSSPKPSRAPTRFLTGRSVTTRLRGVTDCDEPCTSCVCRAGAAIACRSSASGDDSARIAAEPICSRIWRARMDLRSK